MALVKQQIARCLLDGDERVFLNFNDVTLDIMGIEFSGSMNRERFLEIKKDGVSVFDRKLSKNSTNTFRPLGLKMVEGLSPKGKTIYLMEDGLAINIEWLDPVKTRTLPPRG